MRAWPLGCVCLLLLGCRTVPPLPPFDVSQTGWQVRQGQAVWKPKKEAPEIAGELVWAANADGRFLLQFSKTPIALVEAQGSNERWQISFPAQGRTLAGSGIPSPRLGWLHLAATLQRRGVSKGWTFTLNGEHWKLANNRTGEIIEGYLSP